MKWMDTLERRFRHFGIKGLITYIVALNTIVFFFSLVNPSLVYKLLLIPSLVMQGEVWRLVTYLFIPPTFSMLWLLFALYFYYMIGSSLEHEWGTFKFNAYYLIGMICTTAAAFATGGTGSPVFLNLSLLLAFAYIYPNFQIVIFFILPVKMKYLAWAYLAFMGYSLINTPLYGKVAAIVSLFNFIIFFGKDIYIRIRTGGSSYYRRKSYEAKLPVNLTVHRCEICKKTERDDKSLEFRFCVECEGDHEYCMEHLNSHEHVK